MKSYQTFEHTADIGLKIRGRSLEELFEHAAFGFFDLVTDMSKMKREASRAVDLIEADFHLEAKSVEELFLKWLKELLYHFSAKKSVFVRYQFSGLSEKKLKVLAEGLKFDPARHTQKYEIKAVTHHRFELKKEKNHWTAKIIFDI